MKPFIKYPGGKQEELKVITPSLPNRINRYIEPFVGGGAVYLSIEESKDLSINDKFTELTNLYECIKSQNNEFFIKLNAINQNWVLLEKIVERNSAKLINEYIKYRDEEITEITYHDFLLSFVSTHSNEINSQLKINFNINTRNLLKEIEKNLINKTRRMKQIETKKGKMKKKDILDNYEAAFKSGFYMHFRYLYNNIEKYNISIPFHTAIFYFIREFCYASMFRYNKSGGFNVPYGGISYNRKDFSTKIRSLRNEKLIKRLLATEIYNLDFEDFLNIVNPKKDDFIFIDPPYDTDFSTYANNEFDKLDQERLANYLKNTEANFMIVIKNTDFIYSLYRDFNIVSFDKKYVVSFQNRNNQEVEHLLITNYKINKNDSIKQV